MTSSKFHQANLPAEGLTTKESGLTSKKSKIGTSHEQLKVASIHTL